MSILLEISGAATNPGQGEIPDGSYNPSRQMWNLGATRRTVEELLDVYSIFNTTGCGSTGGASGDADPDDA